jgi:hypothetical protein
MNLLDSLIPLLDNGIIEHNFIIQEDKLLPG